MILAKLRWSVLLAVAFAASPAHSDVMEINAEGARWVAGRGVTPVAQPDAAPAQTGVIELGADYAVPQDAVADMASHARGVPLAYGAKVAELAARYDLSPALIEALVWQESRWRPGAVSPVGARGLAQLMPGTARELGVDPHDPFANLEGGARYLRQQLDRFDGDVERALAAYNAGPGRVIRAGGIPRIRETQNYVASILGRLSSHTSKPYRDD